MSSKFNSEFNYRYQVIGETPWEKLHQLKNFHQGRVRAAKLEEIAHIKYKAKLMELQTLKDSKALPHIILNLQAEIMEIESFQQTEKESFELNRHEISILEKLIKELYEIVEPTRLRHEDGTPYSDDEMWEANAANEFTVTIGKEIQAEILAVGRPSPAKLRNAMSNPYTFHALQQVGLIPQEAVMLEGNADPLKIEVRVAPSMVSVSNDKEELIKN